MALSCFGERCQNVRCRERNKSTLSPMRFRNSGEKSGFRERIRGKNCNRCLLEIVSRNNRNAAASLLVIFKFGICLIRPVANKKYIYRIRNANRKRLRTSDA